MFVGTQTHIRTALFTLATMILVGCTQSQPNLRVQPRDEVRAAPLISASFERFDPKAVAEKLPIKEGPNQEYLVLQKSALNKEFLLESFSTPQVGVAASQARQARVVAFVRKGSRVFLLEADEGHEVRPEIRTELILAQVPVITETEETLVLDFASGMQQTFILSPLEVGGPPGTPDEFRAAEVKVGYLDSIRTVGNTLEIRHLAQVVIGNTLPTVEVKYFLSPYLPDPNFEVRYFNSNSEVGLFMGRPRFEEGSGIPLRPVLRVNEREPLMLSMSANTPAKYRDAVQAGALYWNKVFGYEFIQVDVAPKGEFAPHPSRFMIQWIEHDHFSHAYADLSADPRTGEVLRGQVYIPSSFARGKVDEAEQFLAIKGDSKSASQQVELGFMHGTQQPCAYELKGSTTGFGERWAEGYLTLVVAHEIGHLLGLQHNYAGSLGGEWTPHERNQAFEALVKDQVQPTKLAGTTVMDYYNTKDVVLLGASIQNQVLPYDKTAIEFAYQGKEPEGEVVFCSDVHQGVYVDCEPFDSTHSPLAEDVTLIAEMIRDIPKTMLHSFQMAKAPLRPEWSLDLTQAEINPEGLVQLWVQSMSRISRWFAPGIKSVRDSGAILDAGANAEALGAKVAQEFAALGGLRPILFTFVPTDQWEGLQLGNAWSQEFLSLLEGVKTFKGMDGKTHSFTPRERAHLVKWGESFFSVLEQEFIKGNLFVLSQSPVHNQMLASEMEALLGNSAARIILEARSFDESNEEAVLEYRFDQGVRRAAVNLVSPGLGPLEDWNMEIREVIRGSLMQQMEKVLGKPPGQLHDLMLERPKRQWFIQQKQVLYSIP